MPDSSTFIEEYLSATDQCPFRPTGSRWRLVDEAAGRAQIFELRVLLDDRVCLDFVGATLKKQGDGTQALLWLNELADKHGIILEGTVLPIGIEGMGAKALRAWYKKHGFRVHQDGFIERLPS